MKIFERVSTLNHLEALHNSEACVHTYTDTHVFVYVYIKVVIF